MPNIISGFGRLPDIIYGTIYKGIEENGNSLTMKYEVKSPGWAFNNSYWLHRESRRQFKPLIHVTKHWMILCLNDAFWNDNDFTSLIGEFYVYGRGPHENYVDRKWDCFMGIWSEKVSEQAFRIYRPQETGNKPM